MRLARLPHEPVRLNLQISRADCDLFITAGSGSQSSSTVDDSFGRFAGVSTDTSGCGSLRVFFGEHARGRRRSERNLRHQVALGHDTQVRKLGCGAGFFWMRTDPQERHAAPKPSDSCRCTHARHLAAPMARCMHRTVTHAWPSAPANPKVEGLWLWQPQTTSCRHRCLGGLLSHRARQIACSRALRAARGATLRSTSPPSDSVGHSGFDGTAVTRSEKVAVTKTSPMKETAKRRAAGVTSHRRQLPENK